MYKRQENKGKTMFTGIVTDIGEIVRAEDNGGDRRLFIRTRFDLAKIPMGASISCDGCCLTVVVKEGDVFAVDVSNESLSKTTLGGWAAGTKINLESSLKLGDEMGGHMVSGHVDAVATVEDIRPDGDSMRFTIRVPAGFAHYIAPKGSVTLNGVSLTVNEVEGDCFGINIIPHTQDVTTFGALKKGDRLNFEVDMLARYVARMLGKEAA